MGRFLLWRRLRFDFGAASIALTAGRATGDPLGPLFFALALHLAVQRVKIKAATDAPAQLDFIAFYLDDATLAGPEEAVSWFYNALRAELDAIGLQVNAGKSEVVPAAGNESEVIRSRFPDFLWNSTGCFELLGSPFGSVDFCEQVVQQRVGEAVHLPSQPLRSRGSSGSSASHEPLLWLLQKGVYVEGTSGTLTAVCHQYF